MPVMDVLLFQAPESCPEDLALPGADIPLAQAPAYLGRHTQPLAGLCAEARLRAPDPASSGQLPS